MVWDNSIRRQGQSPPVHILHFRAVFGKEIAKIIDLRPKLWSLRPILKLCHMEIVEFTGIPNTGEKLAVELSVRRIGKVHSYQDIESKTRGTTEMLKLQK